MLTVVSAYKAYFFAMAKVDDPFAMSNVLSTAGLVAIIINSLIVVRYGRRRVLLMTGLIGCGVLQLIIAIVYQYQPGKPSTGKVIVGLSCIYMMLYNGCIVGFPNISQTCMLTSLIGKLCMVVWRGDPVSASPKPHLRSSRSRRFRHGVAYYIHCSILH